MWLRAPNLDVTHGFSTRVGGVSHAPYDSLNFDDREDDPPRVAVNRLRALAQLGWRPEQVARLEQVHGAEVVQAQPGVQTGDGLVSDRPGLVLAIGTADCYPVLLHDPEAGVVGAAHAGWRGTVAGVAVRTLEAMTELGADPARVRAAIGPGICADHYEVGPDVAEAFGRAGLGAAVTEPPGRLHLGLGAPHPHLDLLAANRHLLLDAGIQPDHLWAAGLCSFDTEFFSFRRDSGKTGRMWAVIGL